MILANCLRKGTFLSWGSQQELPRCFQGEEIPKEFCPQFIMSAASIWGEANGWPVSGTERRKGWLWPTYLMVSWWAAGWTTTRTESLELGITRFRGFSEACGLAAEPATLIKGWKIAGCWVQTVYKPVICEPTYFFFFFFFFWSF